MKITGVKIRSFLNEGRLLALVSIIIDDSLVVHDIKIIQGNERIFVAMPSRKTEDGKYRDIVHPLNVESRTLIEEKILSTYEINLSEREDTPENFQDEGEENPMTNGS